MKQTLPQMLLQVHKGKGREEIYGLWTDFSLHSQTENAQVDRGQEEDIDIICDLLSLLHAHIHSCPTALLHWGMALSRQVSDVKSDASKQTFLHTAECLF